MQPSVETIRFAANSGPGAAHPDANLDQLRLTIY
ncbi:MAG: hypothetical protein QOJ54_3163, partial [Aliidongia sp.]|nr:hypothetical protein [Aliidongia sp.]